MTRTTSVWINMAWLAVGVITFGGMAGKAIAAPKAAVDASAWGTLPLAELKQKPQPSLAQNPGDLNPTEPSPTETPSPDPGLDLPPETIESSPVLQRWLHEIPDVQHDIRHDPAFRTRLRAGYSETEGEPGFYVGVEDVFLGDTGLTLNAEYQGQFENDSSQERELYGADLRYYVLPLGSVINVAPVVGYRRFNIDTDKFEGLHAGVRAVLALSRTGAADLALTQSWVAPGTADEVGLTTFSVGYAVSDRLRLSTDIQAQNSTQGKDTRFGIGIEWML